MGKRKSLGHSPFGAKQNENSDPSNTDLFETDLPGESEDMEASLNALLSTLLMKRSIPSKPSILKHKKKD